MISDVQIIPVVLQTCDTLPRHHTFNLQEGLDIPEPNAETYPVYVPMDVAMDAPMDAPMDVLMGVLMDVPRMVSVSPDFFMKSQCVFAVRNLWHILPPYLSCACTFIRFCSSSVPATQAAVRTTTKSQKSPKHSYLYQ